MDTSRGSRCAGCGAPLEDGRRNRRYHGPACRKQGFLDRRRTQRAEDDLLRAADVARRLIAEGRIDPLLALSYVIDPTPGVLKALDAVAA